MATHIPRSLNCLAITLAIVTQFSLTAARSATAAVYCELNDQVTGDVTCMSPAEARPSGTFPLESVWMSTDYLMWWTRGANVPALVTGSPNGTPRAQAGVLGQPGTSILFGGGDVNDEMRSGVRTSGGVWFDECHTHGIDFQFFALETKAASYQRSSNGDPILARPFLDANTGQPIAELAAFPGLVFGGIDASVASTGLWGWGANLRRALSQCGDTCSRDQLDFLIGFRHLRLDDQVGIQERLASPLFAAGTELILNDHFATRNAFYGVNLGLAHQVRRDDWRLDSFANVGLGVNSSRVRIQGDTTILSPLAPTVVQPGGLLALQSNMGDYEHTDFAAVFDLGTTVGYRIREHLWLHLGYSFLFWPNVYRAGDQIDSVVNPNLLPPANPQPGEPNRPAYPARDTDFWAHGLNVGIDFRY